MTGLLRLSIALVLLVYAGWMATPFAITVGHALGVVDALGAPVDQVALLDAYGAGHLSVWAVAIGLYFACAARLAAGRWSFVTWYFAFSADLAQWLWIKASPAHALAHDAARVASEYVCLGGNLLVGFVIFWMGYRIGR